jgi:hypothetical protein
MVQSGEAESEAFDMTAGNSLDVGASDAEVVQLTIVERGELANGLLVGSPLLERLTNTHLGVSLCLQGHMLWQAGRMSSPRLLRLAMRLTQVDGAPRSPAVNISGNQTAADADQRPLSITLALLFSGRTDHGSSFWKILGSNTKQNVFLSGGDIHPPQFLIYVRLAAYCARQREQTFAYSIIHFDTRKMGDLID